MKSPYDPIEEGDKDQPDRRALWNQRGRTAPPGESAAALRLRAHQQKMAMRAQREAAAAANQQLGAAPAATGWVGLGPAPLVSDGNIFGMVSGRSTSVAIDPSDTTGNTVFIGGAYGGVWKSINATNADPTTVTWAPVTDQQASLATGAVSVKSDGTVVLVGTGEPNNAIDSYYGVGILRSTDKGATWNLIPAADSGAHSFAGLGVAKFAWGVGNTVVAATATSSKGFDEGAITPNTNRGLYLSTDNGVTWAFQALTDASNPISATDVTYNAMAGKFFAAIRFHGVYSSTNGTSWTRLPNQPNPTALSLANCPTVIPQTGTNCPMFRGQLATVPGRNEMYFWFVDLNDNDGGCVSTNPCGMWRSLDGGVSWTQINETGIAACGDPFGCGTQQAFYNLEIYGVPDGTATDLYAGAVNLFKCKLASGATSCSILDATQGAKWINLTHVYGCNPQANIAHVHPDEHGLDFLIVGGKAVMYFGNDGGAYRTLDGYMDLNSGTCTQPNQFGDLNTTIGSMTQFVSFSIHPTDQNTVLGGTQDNGSPASTNVTGSSQFFTANGGDGGFNAINPTTPTQWFTANTDVTIQVCNNAPNCNSGNFIQVVGNGTVGGDFGPFYTPYILDPQNSGEFLVGTCRVWRGTTVGASFVTLSPNFDTGLTGNAGICNGNEINQVHSLAAGGPKVNNFSNVVYATTDAFGPSAGVGGGEVWVTTNAATTQMSNVTGSINPQNYPISSVAIDGSDTSGQTAFVGIMGFSNAFFPTSHVWKTMNAGTSWTDWTGTGLPDAPVNALLVDSQAGKVYAGTDVGMFVSSTTAAAWTEVGPAPGSGQSGFLPNVPVTAIRLFNNAGIKKLRVSTYGRGIWEFNLAATPDYQIAISNTPQTVFPTQNATFNGTLTALNGYNSPVNLSCTGTPPATCTPSPAQVTPTAGGAAFTVTAGGIVGDYNFNAHGVGTDAGTITHDAAVTLHVVDFNLTAPTPNALSVVQGGTSNQSTFQVTASGSFAGSVTLSCPSGLPTGAACVFSPSSSVSPTSGSPVTVTLTVTATAATPVGGPTTITLQATTAGAPAPKTTTFTLTVTAPVPDFMLAVTATPSATLANQNVVWNGTLTALNGYNKTVNLSCTAGKPGTCTINPASLVPTAGGAAYTVTVGSTTAGTFNFSIQGTDGTLTHSQAVALTVNTDFMVPLTLTDASVQPGQTASTTMQLTPVGGTTFSGAVSYSCSIAAPFSNLTCAFTPPSPLAAGSSATNVAITIKTAGPFTGTQRRIVSQKKPRLWLPLSLPLAGMVLVGLAGRGLPRRYKVVGLCLTLALSGLLVACGGGGGSSPPPPISVTVTPNPVNNLFPNLNGAPPQTQQFKAVVNNSSNQSVTWSVAGGAANGAIDTNGLYTAPAAVPAGPVTVTATAAADGTKSGNATVNIQTPTPAGIAVVTVTVTEATQPQAQHTATFNLTVQ